MHLVSAFPRYLTPLFLLTLAWTVEAAVIEGVVLENRSGKPLARSRVSLQVIRSDGQVSQPSTTADGSGRFRFGALPAGLYRLKAERSGYLTSQFGQRRWNGAGTPIFLDAESRFFADIRVRKMGVITGEVVDENGLGLENITVNAYAAGKRRLRAAASAKTDDRGVYRLSVAPGTYFVASAATRLEGGRGLLTTFLGGGTAAADARAVEVGPDAEQPAAGIVPIAGEHVTLSGAVQGGVPASVTLYTDSGERTVSTGPDGAFSFESVAPGAYPLLALSQAGPPRAAFATVQVGRSTSVGLVLAPFPVARVRPEMTGSERKADDAFVILERTYPFEPSTASVHPGERVAIPPGEYAPHAFAAADCYIDSIRAASRRTASDVRDPDAIEASPGDDIEIVVSLKAGAARLQGKVATVDGEPAAGARVFLKPVEPGRRIWRSAGDRAVAAFDGKYSFLGLAPGRYRVFSSFEVVEPTQADWEADGAQTVTLGENREESLDLTPLGGL